MSSFTSHLGYWLQISEWLHGNVLQPHTGRDETKHESLFSFSRLTSCDMAPDWSTCLLSGRCKDKCMQTSVKDVNCLSVVLDSSVTSHLSICRICGPVSTLSTHTKWGLECISEDIKLKNNKIKGNIINHILQNRKKVCMQGQICKKHIYHIFNIHFLFFSPLITCIQADVFASLFLLCVWSCWVSAADGCPYILPCVTNQSDSHQYPNKFRSGPCASLQTSFGMQMKKPEQSKPFREEQFTNCSLWREWASLRVWHGERQKKLMGYL